MSALLNLGDPITEIYQVQLTQKSGLRSCNACGRIAKTKHRVFTTLMLRDTVIVRLCKQCYGSKQIVLRYGRGNAITKDMVMPEDLSPGDRELVERRIREMGKIA